MTATGKFFFNVCKEKKRRFNRKNVTYFEICPSNKKK